MFLTSLSDDGASKNFSKSPQDLPVRSVSYEQGHSESKDVKRTTDSAQHYDRILEQQRLCDVSPQPRDK